ncbi:MAG: hypothetical protein ACREFP_23315 [Acetobacteraceae bacterium]
MAASVRKIGKSCNRFWRDSLLRQMGRSRINLAAPQATEFAISVNVGLRLTCSWPQHGVMIGVPTAAFKNLLLSDILGAGRRCTWVAALFALAVAPGGCSSVLTAGTAAGAGAAGAGIAHAVTHNAGVTTGIGLGVLAAANAGLQYTERVAHRAEQDRIAAAAGILPVGAVGHWQVTHNIPIEADEHGEVTVSRVLGGPGFACKEIVYSVDHAGKQGTRRAFYTTTICRDGTAWKWALAEPATERWGSLQ